MPELGIAEAEKRRWLAFDENREYVAASAFRFLRKDTDVEAMRELTQPKDEWLSREFPELRIIDPSLAEAVDARRRDRAARYLRAANGQLIGRPSSGAKYLLSGLMGVPVWRAFSTRRSQRSR